MTLAAPCLPMTDWNDLSSHLDARYQVVKTEPHWIGVELALEADAVRIKFERVTAFDTPWLLIIAAICNERQVDALAALRYNALVAVGTLAIENERCYLRATMPLDELRVAALDRTVDFIARESIRLRKEFAPDVEASKELFGHFSE